VFFIATALSAGWVNVNNSLQHSWLATADAGEPFSPGFS
jgi:hypothetical protein